MDKRRVVDALIEHIRREITTISKAARDAREAATHEENRPENSKDTRAIEASYLAGAQAARARELDATCTALATMRLYSFADGRPIGSTALVELEREGATQLYFLSQYFGGVRLAVDESDVHVITTKSPLGAELLAKSEGDIIEVPTRGGLIEYKICHVQ